MRAPDSVVVATLPLFHVFGINAIMNVTIRARPADAGARFDPAKVLEVIERDHASVFGAVPTM
jgi:long-chain acyl-CoA synthetase